MWTGNVKGFLGFVTTIIPPATGSVTSVGLSMPAIFTVSGSPVTTSGTLTATLNTQGANTIFAGPSSGPVSAPTFRTLVDADLPHTNLTMMYFAANQGIDSDAPSGVNTLNIGTANANIINIGWSGATVNVQGTTFYQNVTNLEVTDKLFTVNKGGSAGSGNSAGFEIEEGGVPTGLFATNGTRDGWDFKAPAIAGIATLSLSGLTANRTLTVQDASGTIAYLSDIAANAWALGGNTNAGLQYIGTNNAFDFPIYTNGVEIARFTTGGRLGIGTTTPNDGDFQYLQLYTNTDFAIKAHINNANPTGGYAEMKMTSDISDMRFGTGGTGTTPYGGNAGDCYFGAVSYSSLIMATNNTVRARFDQDGLIGFGTANNPINAQVEIVSSGFSSSAFQVRDVSLNPLIIVQNTGDIALGLAAPSYMLHQQGNRDIQGLIYSKNGSDQSFATAGIGLENSLNKVGGLYIPCEWYGFGWFDQSAIISDVVLSAQNDLVFCTNTTIPHAAFERMRILTTGEVGIGIVTPLARFHAFGRNASNVNTRFEPITDVYEDTLGETVSTTNATTTTIQTIPVPTDTGLLIQAYITCRKTAGAGTGTVGDVNAYIRTVKAKNVGGVVTIGTIEATFTSEDIASFNATFDVSGTDVRVRISGSANNSVDWNVITNSYVVKP